MKKILIIDAHPNENSFCCSIAKRYESTLMSQDVEVKRVRLGDLVFDPILRYGYQKRMDLEPDLLKALELLKWCDLIVWVYPVWWSSMPALAKGFIDRLFLPGLTYEVIPNSYFMKGLLKGKKLQIITTLDQPSWFYKLYFKAPSEHQIKQIFRLCGVKKISTLYFGPIKTSTTDKRVYWLSRVERLALKTIR